MAKKRSTLLLAILGVVVFGVALLIAGAVWFFTTALERTPADEAAANSSFAEVRNRFGNTTPVFGMGAAGPVLNRQPAVASATGEVRNLKILAWNPEDENLAHVTIPFWLVRMRPGNINVAAPGSGIRLSITVDELESYGPALLLDHTDEDGEHVLIWTE